MNCIILIFPAKGFFVIGYKGNLKDEAQTILVELLTQDKNKRLNIDLFISEETETYHENYKITKRCAGGCDCSIIPDMALSFMRHVGSNLWAKAGTGRKKWEFLIFQL